MSLDPETLRQIEELKHDPRPLLVVDVDEVVLEFVTPFANYLGSQDLQLGDAYALHGNVFAKGAEREAVADERVSALINDFWGVQADWQQLAAGACVALEDLSQEAEVVLLTAMPHAYRAKREKHLTSLGLSYPLLTTESAKGPAVQKLRGESGRAVAFVDDSVRNHLSVRAEVPDAALFLLMANEDLRKLLPPTPEGVTAVRDWQDALPRIRSALGLAEAA